MSIKDLERLMKDLRDDPELMREFLKVGDDRQAWVDWGRDRGYLFTAEEAKDLAESRGDVSDEDLEQVAGGWDGGGTSGGP